MKFTNPWIDPRVLQVRPEALRAYLLDHGWEYLGPGNAPDLLMFDTPQPRGDKPNVLLPTRLEHSYQVQRLVELLGEVALYEGRYAGDVLSDVLAQPAPAGPPTSWPVAHPEPAPK